MKFLPLEKLIYKTHLNEEKVIQRLSEIVEPKKTFRSILFGSYAAKAYEGEISGQAFAIRRIIRYRNSFLPEISGSVGSDYDGTTITVKMRMNILVIIFLCFWCAVVVFVGIAFMAKMIATGFNFLELIPVGLLLFVYALTMGGFKWESNKSKKDLQELFEAEISKE